MISIHASRMGGDQQPTFDWVKGYISIHASRMGGDFLPDVGEVASYYFNPRLPDGRRP